MKTLGIAFSILFPNFLFAKSLEAMATTAQTSLSRLGAVIVGLGVLWAGILYIKGSMEGKEKLTNVIIAGVLIFGFAGVLSFLRKITG
jgi:TrbC/VIRB2 pilin